MTRARVPAVPALSRSYPSFGAPAHRRPKRLYDDGFNARRIVAQAPSNTASQRLC
jgi:hypothetical protein